MSLLNVINYIESFDNFSVKWSYIDDTSIQLSIHYYDVDYLTEIDLLNDNLLTIIDSHLENIITSFNHITIPV